MKIRNNISRLDWGKVNFMLIIIAAILALLFLRFCGKEPIPGIINLPNEKTVVNNITQKQKQIHTIEKQIITKQADEKALEDLKMEIFAELAKYRESKDLPKVIETQDSIIKVQDVQIKILRQTVGLKDSIINAQMYIINSKDTLISLSQADAKKFKKQRNILFGIAVAELGIIILK